MLDNLGLVKHMTKALVEKWGYVYGTFGNVLDEKTLKDKMVQYPENVPLYEDFIRKNWLGRRTADCVGVIKSYLWWDGSNAAVYKSSTDVSANGMYSLAKEKGDIVTMPEIPGICVHKTGHIGVYIGGGQVIESHGTKFGVIQTPLKGAGSTSWIHWLKCPFIEYKEEKALNWKDIIGKAASDPDEWEKAIEAAVNAAKAIGDLGELEIFQHLPLLIEKIYNSK